MSSLYLLQYERFLPGRTFHWRWITPQQNHQNIDHGTTSTQANIKDISNNAKSRGRRGMQTDEIKDCPSLSGCNRFGQLVLWFQTSRMCPAAESRAPPAIWRHGGTVLASWPCWPNRFRLNSDMIHAIWVYNHLSQNPSFHAMFGKWSVHVSLWRDIMKTNKKQCSMPQNSICKTQAQQIDPKVSSTKILRIHRSCLNVCFCSPNFCWNFGHLPLPPTDTSFRVAPAAKGRPGSSKGPLSATSSAFLEMLQRSWGATFEKKPCKRWSTSWHYMNLYDICLFELWTIVFPFNC